MGCGMPFKVRGVMRKKATRRWLFDSDCHGFGYFSSVIFNHFFDAFTDGMRLVKKLLHCHPEFRTARAPFGLVNEPGGHGQETGNNGAADR